MRTLAIETSSRQGSLALFEDERCLGEETWSKSQSHSETVTLSLQKLLQEHKMDFADLQLVAVGRGPGSFTGIRIGVSIAKTLGWSRSIPTWGTDSLQILAHQVLRMDPAETKVILSLQNAFGSEFFSAIYRIEDGRLITVRGPQSSRVDALAEEIEAMKAEILCLGDGYNTARSFLPKITLDQLHRHSRYSDFPHARDLGPLARLAHQEDQTYEWNQLQPLYLRASAAEEKLKQGLLKPLPKI